MSTLILNGSPKGEKGNSHIFAVKFNQGMKNSCDIKCVVKEDAVVLAEQIQSYDKVIFIMPLYVHAVPGIVMKLFEAMEPLKEQNKAMGLIIQSGFVEPAQSRYAVKFFEQICRRLNYEYMGTVIKGGAAGTYMMPDKMNKKLYAALEEMGRYYEEQGTFCPRVKHQFEKDYELSKGQAKFNQLLFKLGIGNIMWNSMLKKHNAYEERFARPFL